MTCTSGTSKYYQLWKWSREEFYMVFHFHLYHKVHNSKFSPTYYKLIEQVKGGPLDYQFHAGLWLRLMNICVHIRHTLECSGHDYSQQAHVKTMHMFITWRMNKQNEVYPFKNIIQQQKGMKYWYILPHGWTWKKYAKWKKGAQKTTWYMISFKVSEISSF